MTVVFQRALPGEGESHALVIGIGSYPHLARPGASPPDLSSATAGAKLFADWLIEHADAIRPRLASVDLVLSPPGEAQGVYEVSAPATLAPPGVDPRADNKVEAAIEANVAAAGERWQIRCTASAENAALLYLCGHGVATTSRTMVFLSDVARVKKYPWNPHIDVQLEAARMRRQERLKLGCIFVDACQEVIKEADLADTDKQKPITDAVALFEPGSGDDRNNVYALVPGPRGSLAFDDGRGSGGRYTHILLQALRGAAVCNFDGVGGWGVLLDDLHAKMKALHGLRRLEWPEPMDPTPVYTANTEEPLVQFSVAPRVPICLCIKPPAALGAIDQLLLEDSTNIVYQAKLAAGVGAANNDISVLAELLVAWPPATLGVHFIKTNFVGPPTYPNSGRRTQIDISEMRVRPWIIHDVG